MNEQRNTLFLQCYSNTRNITGNHLAVLTNICILYLLGQNDYQLAEDVDEIQEQIN